MTAVSARRRWKGAAGFGPEFARAVVRLQQAQQKTLRHRRLVRCVLPRREPGNARAAAGHALALRSSPATTAPAASAPVALRLPAAVPYRDCTGVTPLTRTTVYRDTCLSGVYLVEHNPGAFTPLLSFRVGSEVSYEGRTYTIRSVALRTPSAQWAEAQAHPAALTLQTCVNDAAGSVWVLTAS